MAGQALTGGQHGWAASSSGDTATIESPGARAVPDYLEALYERAEHAASAAGGYVDFDYRVAGRALRLRFAGPALVSRLAPALAHLRAPAVGAPALTVRLFDSHSTGIGLPPSPWGAEPFERDGKVHASVGGRLTGIFDAGTFSVHDPRGDRGLYWVRGPDDIRPSETGSPLLRILDLWLGAAGIQPAHAAAVGDPGGCVLIVGAGGAGKTSTALSCLDSELRIIGDDYCLLAPGDTPQVHSIYSAAKVDDDARARLPELAAMIESSARRPGEKALIYLHERVPGKLLMEAPLRAIAIPRVTGARDTHTAPVPASAALGALAPSTLLQLAGSDREAFARLARAVRAVPCHRLELGTDRAQVPPALGALLRT